MIRMPVKGISVIGRNTQGVRLVNLAQAEGDLLPDAVAAVTRVVAEEDTSAVNGAAGDGESGNGEPAGEETLES
jgi:DNA gyrase subunit A